MLPISRMLCATLFLTTLPAVAQHLHDHKPKRGGLVKEQNQRVYELVANAAEIVVYVLDEKDKAIDTQGSRATLTLIDSGLRQPVPLTPAGDNRLAATGPFRIKPGMSALLEISIGTKQIAKILYVLK